MMCVVQTKKAFSLIELMIVITIIGILAAVAVPSYQSYVVRSKFAEIFAMLRPYQIEAEEAFITTGNPPADRTDSSSSALLDNIHFYNSSGAEVIHVRLANFYPGWVTGHQILLRGDYDPATGVSWRCCLHGNVASQPPKEFLPPQCSASTC